MRNIQQWDWANFSYRFPAGNYMLHWFYCLPLYSVVVLIISTIFLCGMFSYFLQRKSPRSINKVTYVATYIILLLVSVTLIYNMTLYNRTEGIRFLNLVPFYSFVEAKIQPEMYRTMLMNVALFTPFGISCASLFKIRFSKKATTIITVIIAFWVSCIIEYCQYFFSIGLTQTDDIICNTFGALIGTTVILVPKIVNNKILDNYNFK